VQPGHKDGEVTVRDETKVDPEHGRDHTSSSKTKVEIERGPLGQYTGRVGETAGRFLRRD
jgi:hypothetical protein